MSALPRKRQPSPIKIVGKSAIQPITHIYLSNPTHMGFHLKGLNTLKAFMDSTYFTLVMSYTFAWDKTSQRFRIIEFLPQRIFCVFTFILITIHYVSVSWTSIFQVSSHKKDLINCFIFVRHLSTIITYLTYLQTAVWKRGDFVKLLDLISKKVIVGEASVVQKRIHLGVPFIFMMLAYTMLFTCGLAPILQKGLYDAGLVQLNNWVDESSVGYPALRKYVPEKDSWTGVILGYVVLFMSFQTNVAFWSFILFNLVFILFLRSNLKSFRDFVEKFEKHQKSQLYEEYLYLKSLVDHVNKFIGPRVFAFFLSVIPFFSYFLSSFSSMAEKRVEILFFFVVWTVQIWTIFIIAADTSTLTGEIKRALIVRKRELDGSNESSDLAAMLMDMPIGNELGISCCGCFIIDYSLIGSMLGSIFTFAIILIQAE